MQARESSRSWAPIGVTCSTDQRRHLVDDVSLTRGAADSSGRFPALCGHTVLAASLADPPGQDCPLCVAVHGIGSNTGRVGHYGTPSSSALRWMAGVLLGRSSVSRR